MHQLILGAAAYAVVGILVALQYAISWHVMPRLSHIACWPLVAHHSFWGKRLPRWLKPA